MDVIFEIPNERQFDIEVGFFDTVLEMKQKIKKYQGFPIEKQTLVFNGRTLADDHDTEYYDVLQGSRIHLLVEPEPGNQIVRIEEGSSSAPTTKVQLLITISASKRQFTLAMDVTDTILQLKERISEREGIPVGRFALFSTEVELQDHRPLRDYAVSDISEINVIIKPFPPPVTTTTTMAATATATAGTGSIATVSGSGSGSRKLKLMVLPKCGTKKIHVEMNGTDNVGDLRKELQRLHQHLHFHLPAEGYFFIYKQNVMDDDKSFRWHNVRQGDTIEIFGGSVTGGS